MRNLGTVSFRGRTVPVQVDDHGHIYVSAYPIEQYPRELREKVRDFVREIDKE